MADSYRAHTLFVNATGAYMVADNQLDQYLNLDNIVWNDAAFEVEPTSSREFFQKIPFTTFNYAPAPPVKLNQLYWPTGATRWGTIRLVLSGEINLSFNPILSFSEFNSTTKLGSVDIPMVLMRTGTLVDGLFVAGTSRPGLSAVLVDLADRRVLLNRMPWVPEESLETIQDYIDALNAQADGFLILPPPASLVAASLMELDHREFQRQDLNLAQVIDAIAAATATVVVCEIISGSYALSFHRKNLVSAATRSANVDYVGGSVFGTEIVYAALQVRRKTRWHRYNGEQELIEPSEVDTMFIKNIVPCSAFWDDSDQTSNDLIGLYANYWNAHWNNTNPYSVSYPVLFPFDAQGNPESPLSSGHATGDHVLIEFHNNRVCTTYVPHSPWFFPSSLLVQRELVDTWENLIVKTPSGGIPARTGTELTTASCDIYELDQNTMLISDTGDNVDVYSVGGAVPGNTYIVAVLMNDGTYAAVSGGSSGSLEILYVSPINAALMPGGAVDCNIMEYTGTEFQDSGAAPIEVRDSAKNNCVMAGEVVQAILSSVTGYYEVLGSSGLRRHVRADEALIPGQSSTLGPPPPTFVNEIQATMLDWTETYANRWRYADNGETSSFQVTVFDPALRSVVLPGEIVQVHYHQKQDRWMIEGGHGLLRRAQLYATDYLEVEAEGDFAIEDPNNAYTAGPGLQGYLVRGVNRSDRAVKKDSWTHILWTPSEGYTNEYGLRHGRWVMITDLAKTVDVKLLRASGGGELGQDHRYIILDPLSDRVLDDGNGNGVDPTSAPHKWRRMADVDYYAADWGLAWFDGRELNANSVPIGRYHLRWINEEPDTLSCTSTTEPPPPTEPPPVPPPVDPPPPVDRGPGYYCVQNSSGTGMICRYFSADPGYGVGAYGDYPTCLLNCDAQLP